MTTPDLSLVPAGQRLLGAALLVGTLAWTAPADVLDFIDYNDNIALASNGGSGISGVNTADDGTYGINFDNPFNSITAAVLVDGTTGGQTVDTFGPGKDENNQFYDFLGVTWATPHNDVAAVRFWHYVFNDGGFFDHPGLTIVGDTGDTISLLPRIQYTTDGTTWLDANEVTNTYADVITDSTVPAFALRGPIDFTFDPVDGVTGIRLFGDGWVQDGGAGGNEAGFVGGREFEVYTVPEPATLGLMAIGAGYLLGRQRRF